MQRSLSTKRWKYVRFLINRWLSPAVPCWRRWDLLVRNWRVATCSFVGKCPEGTDGHAFFHHPPACWSSLRLSIHPQSWWMAYSLLLITCYELVVHLRQHYTPSFYFVFLFFIFLPLSNPASYSRRINYSKSNGKKKGKYARHTRSAAWLNGPPFVAAVVSRR